MKHPWDPQQFSVGAKAAGLSAPSINSALATASGIKSVHPDLPVVLSLGHLSHLTEVPLPILDAMVRRSVPTYRVFRVKKRGTPRAENAPARRYRTICVPDPALMRVQRWVAQNVLNPIAPHPDSFAFAPKRYMLDAVDRHVNARWLVKIDVRHFFESLVERQVYRVFRSLGYAALLSFQLARLCTRVPERAKAPDRKAQALPYRPESEGQLPQGAPTSPMLANLIVRDLDARLAKLALQGGWRFCRYADDLAFSCSHGGSRSAAMALSRDVERELVRFGLRANRQKTTVIPPGARKVLLGLLVDRSERHLTRAFRNNVETHIYALTSKKIGVAAHQRARGFASIIGMRRHVEGLVAYARHVDTKYGDKLKKRLETVTW